MYSKPLNIFQILFPLVIIFGWFFSFRYFNEKLEREEMEKKAHIIVSNRISDQNIEEVIARLNYYGIKNISYEKLPKGGKKIIYPAKQDEKLRDEINRELGFDYWQG